jgi:hypothetical protein
LVRARASAPVRVVAGNVRAVGERAVHADVSQVECKALALASESESNSANTSQSAMLASP